MNIKHLEVKRAYYNNPENVVVQYESKTGGWVDCKHEPGWAEDYDYRIKPRTIRIGEIDVPDPVREPLEIGDVYFVSQLTLARICEEFVWAGDSVDARFLERGLVHLTKEAAELHAKALILVSGGRDE